MSNMSIHMDMLEQSIISLKEYMVQVFAHYPAMENTWYTMSRQEQAILAYQKVEEVLVAVREGETCLLYPSLNDWANVQHHPAYGLLPVESPRLSQIP